jgi:hypothetical protein
MVKKSEITPHIGMIFDTHNKEYENNSKLCQDILRYPFKSGKTQFRLYEDLAKWLFDKNREFVDEYSDSESRTPIRTRFANKRQRIERKIDDLINLGLLEQKGTVKATKVNHDMPLFGLTSEGKLVALILERVHKQDRTKINQDLYQFIISWLQQFNSSKTIFVRSIYDRYYSENQMDIPLDIITDHLLDRIRWIFDLISILTYTPPTDPKNHKRHFKYVYETLQSLDPNIRRSVLLFLKQSYEHQILITYPDRKWEEEYLKYLDNENFFTLRGKCRNCKQIYYIPTPTEIFLEAILLRGGYPLMNCNECSGENTIVIGVKIN